jgi:hypothetical protein
VSVVFHRFNVEWNCGVRYVILNEVKDHSRTASVWGRCFCRKVILHFVPDDNFIFERPADFPL